ncbi:myelin-associated glycoprotein-like [Scyliorhinus canicula]|uniref:myelin-associated glycoprotein-like n=1 Tax=Scyliorhinus canicula TaxID=7830 RepID=UPI0018F79A33|nr:myelin-associated glycoprotein-like [Scyliorhinus canicula]
MSDAVTALSDYLSYLCEFMSMVTKATIAKRMTTVAANLIGKIIFPNDSKIIKESLVVYYCFIHSSQWIVRVSWAVKAVRGSCAEISCTFDYPAKCRNPRILWSKGGLNPRTPGVSVIYNSGDPADVDPEYKGRTELRGNLTEKQCTLLIKDIRREDEGNYYITLKSSIPCKTERNHYRDTPVSLSIVEKPWISVPGQLMAGKPAHLTCSFAQSCSTANFKLQWIREAPLPPILPDPVTSQLIRNSLDDSWTVSSTYSFTPSLENPGEMLTCKLITADGQTTGQDAARLGVQYALWKPIINSSIVTVEGSSFLLYCKSLAIPPVNVTLSRRGVEISNSSASDLKFFIHNVSSGDEGEYWCEAANKLGAAMSSTNISVQYKPTIVSDLNCTHSKNGVYCICLVRANPPANITWNFAGRNLTGNISEVAVHSWPVGGRLVQSSLTLTLPTESENRILCVAENEHGVSVREHQLHSPGTFPWLIVIATGTAAIIILILILVKLQRKKTRDTAANDDSVIYAVVQHPLNTQSQGLDSNIDGPGTASKPAQCEEVLYAALNISNIRKPEIQLQIEEPSEYAAIKYKLNGSGPIFTNGDQQ